MTIEIQALLALIGIGVALMCVFRPHLGLAVMLFIMVPAPLFPAEGSAWAFYGFAIFTLFVLVGWILQSVNGTKPFEASLPREGLSFYLLLWLAYLSLGVPLSILFNTGTLSDQLYFFVRGALPSLYLSLCFVVRMLPCTVRQARRIVDWLLCVAIAFALITFAVYATAQQRVTWIYPPLAFPFPVLGANVTFARMLDARSRSSTIGWAALTGILALASLLTFTKSETVALVLSLLFVAALLGVKRGMSVILRGAAFVGTIVIFTLVLAAYAPKQNRTVFSAAVAARLGDDSSTESRLTEWESALGQFAESPIIGKGIGYQLERAYGSEVVSSNYVHNQIVYTAMTMGITGLILYAMLMYHWVRLALSFKRVSPEVAWIVAALHGSVLALTTYALLFATFRTIQHNLVLGLSFGLILKLSPKPERRAWYLKKSTCSAPRAPWRRLISQGSPPSCRNTV